MKNLFAAIMASTLVSLLALSDPALAQQKTAKACQDEWRANKQANQAAGVTEKAYVDKCRAGGAAEQPAAAPGGGACAEPGTGSPEDRQAVPAGMAGEQGGVPGGQHHREGLRRQMPRR
jgi:hypothetical protein